MTDITKVLNANRGGITCRILRSLDRMAIPGSELWDDGIIDPADTRKALGMVALNCEFHETPNRVLRI